MAWSEGASTEIELLREILEELRCIRKALEPAEGTYDDEKLEKILGNTFDELRDRTYNIPLEGFDKRIDKRIIRTAFQANTPLTLPLPFNGELLTFRGYVMAIDDTTFAFRPSEVVLKP